jgi:alpha-N-arabinofuranosidase
MANLAQLVNVIAPIFTSKDGLFLQTTYFPIAEYGKQKGNVALDLWVSSPTYSVGGRPPLNYLDTSCTYDRKGGTLYLNVLNRSEKLDITAQIENQTGELSPAAQIWQLNHPDLKATHTFGNDTKVRPTTGSQTLSSMGRALSFSFPAHSLTILKMILK